MSPRRYGCSMSRGKYERWASPTGTWLRCPPTLGAVNILTGLKVGEVDKIAALGVKLQ